MIIKINNLSCGYKENILINKLNCIINSGESTCVLGANGIGKTTFFKTVLGFLSPIEGNVEINNRDINQIPLKELAKYISYVPQIKKSSYDYSVLDVVLMGRAPYIKPFASPKEKDYEIAYNALNLLEIEHLSKKNYSHLSGGEQQVVLIARAISQKARFILLDEPASNLDFYNKKKLIDTINLLKKQGAGILMVSHSPMDAFECCEKTILLLGKGEYIYGDTNKVINSKNLSKVYSVKLIVDEIKSNNKSKKVCVLE